MEVVEKTKLKLSELSGKFISLETQKLLEMKYQKKKLLNKVFEITKSRQERYKIALAFKKKVNQIRE